MNRETALMRNIRLAVNRTGRARLVRNNVGRDQTTHTIYGLGVGSADLVGMLLSGRAIALEVKTDTGRLRDEQKAWLASFRRWGGFAAVVRSIDEAVAAIGRAEQGASE